MLDCRTAYTPLTKTVPVEFPMSEFKRQAIIPATLKTPVTALLKPLPLGQAAVALIEIMLFHNGLGRAFCETWNSIIALPGRVELAHEIPQFTLPVKGICEVSIV
jgi:hypothetical protein